MTIDIPLSLPLDDEGFLRRACPHCAREFRWHNGPLEGAPEDAPTIDEYYCPYCGQAAALDQWWTEAQLQYARETAMTEVMPQLREQFRSALEPLNRSGFIKADVHTSGDEAPPSPLIEDPDMVMVGSPCHTYEPVKVAEGWDSPLYCLVCGSPYVLPAPSK